MAMYLSTITQLIAIPVYLALVVSAQYTTTKCRHLPGDDGWPSVDEWKALNASVSGRLIKTRPAGHVCHEPTYNTEACQALNSTWKYPSAQYVVPVSTQSITDPG
jgi:hypothetical protein